MGKILLIVSFVVSLATAAIGFINKGKLSEANQAVESTKSSLAQASSQLKKKDADLDAATKNAAAATARAEAAAADLAAAKTATSDATATVNKLTTDATALNSKVTELTATVDDLKRQLADKGNLPAETNPVPNDLQVQLDEAKLALGKAQTDLDAAHTQLEAAKVRDQARTNNIMKKGLEGRILAVNPSWNFVVLNLGDKNGVANNAEMLIKRGNQLIGKVRITSVEPSTSIADIVANSVPSGTTISPGDNVIYQTVSEE